MSKGAGLCRIQEPAMTELLSIAPTLSAPMPGWETKQVEHGRRNAELRPFNKTAVFDALAAAGITIVVVAFDGYGDSGQIENVEAKAGEDLVALPSREVEIASAVWDQADPERTAMTVHDAIERLVFDFLGMTHDGWKTATGPMATSRSTSLNGRSRSTTTSATCSPNIPSMSFEEATMGHCYHHALSSVKKWGGTAEDYLAAAPVVRPYLDSQAILGPFLDGAGRPGSP
jgi:hypothetical protein